MRISVMPSLQRWRYKFLMKQKIVTVKLLERWDPATQNNLNVMCCVFQNVISGRMKTAVYEYCARESFHAGYIAQCR